MYLALEYVILNASLRYLEHFLYLLTVLGGLSLAQHIYTIFTQPWTFEPLKQKVFRACYSILADFFKISNVFKILLLKSFLVKKFLFDSLALFWDQKNNKWKKTHSFTTDPENQKKNTSSYLDCVFELPLSFVIMAYHMFSTRFD